MVKATIPAFQFLAEESKSDYILKTDSDCVLNILPIIDHLNFMDFSNMSYDGNCFCVKSNWLAHYKTFIHLGMGEVCYASGGGYILKTDILSEYVTAAKYLQFYLPVEDFTTGYIMRKINKPCTPQNYTSLWLNLRPQLGELDKYKIIHMDRNISMVKQLNCEWYNL